MNSTSFDGFTRLLLALQENLLQWLYNFTTNNIIGFVATVLTVYSFVQKANHYSLLSAWSANVIAVLFHELAHAIIGLITGTKPIRFMVFPEKHKDQDGKVFYTLGTVTHKNLRWYNAFPSAMAPLLLLFIAYGIEKYYWTIVQEKTFLNLVLYIYLMIIFLINAKPSSIDFIVGFKNPFGLILWFSIIFFVLWLANIS